MKNSENYKSELKKVKTSSYFRCGRYLVLESKFPHKINPKKIAERI